MDALPIWMSELEEEDTVFIKKFILASGSLKEVAAQYGVTTSDFSKMSILGCVFSLITICISVNYK